MGTLHKILRYLISRGRGDTAHFNLGHLVGCSNLGGDTAQNFKMFEKQGGAHRTFYLRVYIWLDIQIRVGTPHTIQRTSLFELFYSHFFYFSMLLVGGWFLQKIKPLCGSILQVGTCQILSLAENPRWSQV